MGTCPRLALTLLITISSHLQATAKTAILFIQPQYNVTTLSPGTHCNVTLIIHFPSQQVICLASVSLLHVAIIVFTAVQSAITITTRVAPGCFTRLWLQNMLCVCVCLCVLEGEVTLYHYGWKDSATILFYFFIAIILHAVVQEYLLDVSIGGVVQIAHTQWY